MNNKDIVELTKKLYKLTLLFPKKEPLRYRIRETADEILASLVRLFSMGQEGEKERDRAFSIKTELEVIDAYFEIAKWQNWVSYFDILEIQQEYAKIRDNLIIGETRAEQKEIVEQPAEEKPERSQELDSRKEKILKVLEKAGRIQVGEINKIFPDVSKRTIRRDFHKLVEQGIVERIGSKNDTFYQTKTQNIEVGQ